MFRYKHLKWHFIVSGVCMGIGISVLMYLYPHWAFLVFFPIAMGLGYMEITLTKFNRAHKEELETMCAKHGTKLGRNLNFLEKLLGDDKDVSE